MTTVLSPPTPSDAAALVASVSVSVSASAHEQQLPTHDATSNVQVGDSSPALPSRPGFHDATEDLFAACAELRDGQMVAVPNFSLMDSMAAVKIMDARMDSGMQLPTSELPESDRLDPTSAPSATSEFDPFQPLTVPEVLWIMDRLLACEAAWHQGSALSQTLYTCLYFHAVKSLSHKHPRFQRSQPSQLDPADSAASASGSASDATTTNHPHMQLVYKVLRAFILATVKTIDIAWTELTSKQHLHDGEDFSSDKNGLSLLETTDYGYAIAELEDALEWVESQKTVLLSDQIESLKTRLGFRKQMLYAVRLLQAPAEAAPLEVVMHTNFARRKWALLRPVSAPMTGTVGCDPRTSSQEETSQNCAGAGNVASPPPPIQPLPLQAPNRNAAPSPASLTAFDPAYNRRLAWCQALRPISLPNANETWCILDGILEELQDVVRVLQHPGLLTWKAFFTHRATQYQRSQQLSAMPYVRSLLQTAVCDRNMIASRLPLEWLAETFFHEVALVDPLLLRRASRIGRNNIEGGSQIRWNAPPPLGQRVHYFMQRVSGQLVQYLTTLSQNRARCKRTFASRLYREWVHISEEAGDIGRELEACLAPGERYIPDSLFAASQHLALEIMTQITLSGFELELYSNGTDRESMWWLASRIQVEQKLVCTDLRDELSKWLGLLAPEQRPRRHSATILYLSRQLLLAQALEQLTISTVFLIHLSRRNERGKRGLSLVPPWPLKPEDDSSSVALAAAVFATRTKWMRANVHGGHQSLDAADQQEPGETLWQEYQAFGSELNSTDDSTLMTITRERLEEAIKHLQQLAVSLAGEHKQKQELGAAGFSDMVKSLLATARHNHEALEKASAPQAHPATAIDSGDKAKAAHRSHNEWSFEHPWIPKWIPA